nr:MAG TPA: hypothetical protein [Caudoviricetes sp.]
MCNLISDFRLLKISQIKALRGSISDIFKRGISI